MAPNENPQLDVCVSNYTTSHSNTLDVCIDAYLTCSLSPLPLCTSLRTGPQVHTATCGRHGT
eukprot:9981014-Lingulodinium_polyedra.AAC.1